MQEIELLMSVEGPDYGGCGALRLTLNKPRIEMYLRYLRGHAHMVSTGVPDLYALEIWDSHPQWLVASLEWTGCLEIQGLTPEEWEEKELMDIPQPQSEEAWDSMLHPVTACTLVVGDTRIHFSCLEKHMDGKYESANITKAELEGMLLTLEGCEDE